MPSTEDPPTERGPRRPEAAPPLIAVLDGPAPSGLYTAAVLSFPLSLVVGPYRAATREGALGTLKARLAELGRPTHLAVFPDVESAQREAGRRDIARDLLAGMSSAYRSRIAEIIPDRPDLATALDDLARALAAVASGRREVESAPVRDGRIVCPRCDVPGTDVTNHGYGFRATADALVTVDLTDDGEIRDVSYPEVQIDPRGFRELVCRWCEAELPDLGARAFYALRAEAREGSGDPPAG